VARNDSVHSGPTLPPAPARVDPMINASAAAAPQQVSSRRIRRLVTLRYSHQTPRTTGGKPPFGGVENPTTDRWPARSLNRCRASTLAATKPIPESSLDRVLTVALVLGRGRRELVEESGSRQDIVP
jgi:hypothetical protein